MGVEDRDLKMVLIQVEPLQRLIEDIFQAEGCFPEEAGRIAKNLVGANLTGHDSHGVLRTDGCDLLDGYSFPTWFSSAVRNSRTLRP